MTDCEFLIPIVLWNVGNNYMGSVNYSDLYGSFKMWINRHKNVLLCDSEFIQYTFDPDEKNHAKKPDEKFSLLVGEAEKTLQMIGPYLKKGIHILEVGGGVGLVYAFLRFHGFNIVSLEPGSSGFGNRHKAGLRLMKALNIDPEGWKDSGIENYTDAGKEHKYDLIFSYFVLEHIQQLSSAFSVMSKKMTQDGLMIHRCPNYTIPFEPHYNLPLIPIKPVWTSYVFPKLENYKLWKSLNFTTVKKIEAIAAENNLILSFHKGMLAWGFNRILTDPHFAARKKGFYKIAQFLNFTYLIKLIQYLPPTLCTPMEFTAKKNQN